MTGETERDVSGWTVDTYRIHNEAMRFADEKFQAERNQRYLERFEAQALAVKTAAEVVNLRLLGMNEWRLTVTDLLTRTMPRTEAEQHFVANSKELASVISRLDRMEGKGVGLAAMWGYIIGALGLGAAIVSLFLRAT